MRYFRSAFALAIALAAAAGFVGACGEDAESSELGALDDAGSGPLIQDARALGDGGGPAVSTMRFAHVAPGIGAVDFCYQAARGGAAIGPVLGGGLRLDAGGDAAVDADPADGEADAGGAPRRAVYRSVTKYLSLETAGAIAFTIVAAGSTSCANPLLQAVVTLDPGKLATVVLFGAPADGGVELSLASFTDGRKTEPDTARVRVIHAALGRPGRPAAGPLAAYAVGAIAVPLAPRVEARRAASANADAGIDELGYVSSSPLPNPAALALDPLPNDAGVDGGPTKRWVSAATDIDLRGDSLHTAFVLSARAEDDSLEAPWFEVLWCADTTTSGVETSCAHVR